MGLVLGALAASDSDGFYDDGPGWVLAGTLGGAMYGTLIGLGIGALSSHEDWQAVPLSGARPVRLSAFPAKRGIALVASLRF